MTDWQFAGIIVGVGIVLYALAVWRDAVNERRRQDIEAMRAALDAWHQGEQGDEIRRRLIEFGATSGTDWRGEYIASEQGEEMQRSERLP